MAQQLEGRGWHQQGPDGGEPGRRLPGSVAWADACIESPVGENLEMSREAGEPPRTAVQTQTAGMNRGGPSRERLTGFSDWP